MNDTLFNLDDIPAKTESKPERQKYHLYFDKDGVRRFLYLKHGVGYGRRFQWLTAEEAGKRKRHQYNGSAAATGAKRAWQHMAKDGVVICIGAEVTA